MPKMPPTYRPAHARTKTERNREYDARRREAKPWRKFYGTEWQKLRLLQLGKEPLCIRCKRQGRLIAATIVNHIKAHKGDWGLFIDTRNHESVCKRCHDRDIQREEKQIERAL